LSDQQECYTARQMISGLDHSNFRRGFAEWPTSQWVNWSPLKCPP